MDSCSYDLDADLRLCAVGAGWNGFAHRNGAPQLADPGPLDRPLDGFIQDPSTRQLYDRLFEAARRSGRPVSVPFRCDAPGRRRCLELHIESKAGGGYRVRSELLREEPREPVALLEPGHSRDARLLKMCSFCKRVHAPAGWMEAEPAVRAMGLFAEPVLPAISHGVCPRCFGEAMAAIGAVDGTLASA